MASAYYVSFTKTAVAEAIITVNYHFQLSSVSIPNRCRDSLYPANCRDGHLHQIKFTIRA